VWQGHLCAPTTLQLLLLVLPLPLLCWCCWLRVACGQVGTPHKHGGHMDVIHVLLMLLEQLQELLVAGCMLDPVV
jgi:hypothetical protein